MTRSAAYSKIVAAQCETVLRLLADGEPHTITQLAQASGIERGLVHERLYALLRQRKVKRLKDRSTYQIVPITGAVAGPPYVREGRYRTGLNNVYSNGGGFSTRVRGGWRW